MWEVHDARAERALARARAARSTFARRFWLWRHDIHRVRAGASYVEAISGMPTPPWVAPVPVREVKDR